MLLPAQVIHESALRPIDRFSDHHLFFQRFDLLVERFHFSETSKRHLYRRQQLTFLERFHEVGERTGVAGPFDQVSLAERRQYEDCAEVVGAYLAGGLETVHPRHLDVEYCHVGPVFANEFHDLVPAARLRDDLVVLLLHDLLQIEADYRLVFGKHDFYCHVNSLGSPRNGNLGCQEAGWSGPTRRSSRSSWAACNSTTSAATAVRLLAMALAWRSASANSR